MEKAQYIQYGCGCSAANNWRNFDASPTLRFERIPIIGKLYNKNESRFPEGVEYGDIVKGLPVKRKSCQGVYCSHVLEHLSLQDIRIALSNTYEILHEGGIFRLVMPDLEQCIRNYSRNDSHEAAITFMKDTSLGEEKRCRGLRGLIFGLIGNSKHLWMWDYKSIEHELGQAGFKEIRRAQFRDSIDAMFQAVEDVSRWQGCLGVECRK